jgi:hypothetical protein
MGHNIAALLIHRPFDPAVAAHYDLIPVALDGGITLFHITHYYSAYWGHIAPEPGGLDVPASVPGVFPNDAVLRRMARELTLEAAPTFAVIMTEYFGGVGDQWACAFNGTRRVTGDKATINDVLRALGVVRRGEADEFDTVGLGRYRSTPDALDRYVDLCDEVGV